MLDDSLNNGISDAEASKRIAVGESTLEIEVVNESLTAPSGARGKTRHPRKKPNWQPYIDIWARRSEEYDKAERSRPFLTPTLLKRLEETSTEAGGAANVRAYRQTPALLVGELAHRFLQDRYLTANGDDFEDQLRDFIGRALPREYQADRVEIESELRDIFRGFYSSQAHAELAAAHILGREVPLLIPWDGKIMEGIIDLIYERDGLLCVADYKTDRIAKNELHEAAERYRQQAEIYSRAASQSLRREVAAFKLIFLRLGEAVQVPVSQAQGELFT
jgi:ATP-dependent helicase/nuclease subunit A